MSDELKGIYKREPKAERPTHIYVENAAGLRYPVTLAEYEGTKIAPHWRRLPWETEYKVYAAGD